MVAPGIVRPLVPARFCKPPFHPYCRLKELERIANYQRNLMALTHVPRMDFSMGYQALLFCPEEKIARTVTLVLRELEFSVEPCAEAFTAVKKLMAQHFDAIVVDCENEQNAALLFKSARNSASNQASLAVAVVEGQAGVAKAFRIGANLVLTKPINVEQAKGTLRVARGLLRKGEPGKPAAPGAPSVTGEETPKVRPSRPLSAVASGQTTAAPLGANAAAIPTASAKAGVGEKGSSPSVSEKSRTARSAPEVSNAAESRREMPSLVEKKAENNEEPAAVRSSGTSLSTAGTGAATAPALVRVAEIGEFRKSLTPTEPPTSAHSSTENEPVPAITSASSFTFGEANASAEESSAGRKKIMMGVAAAALVAFGLYAGWAHFHGKAASDAAPERAESGPVTSSPDMARPSPPTTSSELKKPQPSSAVEAALGVDKPHQSADISPDSLKKNPSKISASDSFPSEDFEPKAATPAPAIVVKNGSMAPARHKTSAQPDAPAPSMIGLPATGGGSLPNLINNSQNAATPVLQALNVSQGVSQGLIMKKVQPVYPPSALHLHMEGSVQLLATISKAGDITAVKSLSGELVFARAAMDAVKQWKYKPYLLNGEPVEIQTQITVNFKLPR